MGPKIQKNDSRSHSFNHVQIIKNHLNYVKLSNIKHTHVHGGECIVILYFQYIYTFFIETFRKQKLKKQNHKAIGASTQ